MVTYSAVEDFQSPDQNRQDLFKRGLASEQTVQLH